MGPLQRFQSQKGRDTSRRQRSPRRRGGGRQQQPRDPPVCEEAADEVLGVVGQFHVIRELEGVLVVHDLAVGADQTLGVEGRVADQHLVEDHADRPPVALAAVNAVTALRLEHLRRDVVRCADRRVRADQTVL